MHSSLHNRGLKVGLVKMHVVPIRTEVPRAALTVANLNEWHHPLFNHPARDPGVLFHCSFSLTHSPLVMKSILLLPGPLQCSPSVASFTASVGPSRVSLGPLH